MTFEYLIVIVLVIICTRAQIDHSEHKFEDQRDLNEAATGISYHHLDAAGYHPKISRQIGLGGYSGDFHLGYGGSSLGDFRRLGHFSGERYIGGGDGIGNNFYHDFGGSVYGTGSNIGIGGSHVGVGRNSIGTGGSQFDIGAGVIGGSHLNADPSAFHSNIDTGYLGGIGGLAHANGGEISNEKIYSGENKNLNDEAYKKINNNAQQQLNHGENGFLEANLALQKSNSGTGYFNGEESDKNVIEDKKIYKGGQVVQQEGEN